MTTDNIKQGLGYGYKKDDGKVCMIRCFKCGKENWALSVSGGTCAVCGFDANKCEPEKPKID